MWDESADVGIHEDGSIGIYWVFASVIAPFLKYALTPEADAPDSVLVKKSWRDIPASDTPELEELIDRLYEILELWAASPSQYLRDATFIEVAESDMGHLTVDELTRRGGPYLKSLYLDHEGGRRVHLSEPTD